MKAARCYLDGKALGPDGWRSAELAGMPEQITERLVGDLVAMQDAGLWVFQLLGAEMGLIAKPRGGDRAVAKTAMLYRMWNCTRRPEMKHWEVAEAAVWDNAQPGMSIEIFAATRLWEAEVARENGETTGGALYDVETFSDTVDHQRLCESIEASDVPAIDALMGTQMHFAHALLLLTGWPPPPLCL